jgi:hypothetical protein
MENMYSQESISNLKEESSNYSYQELLDFVKDELIFDKNKTKFIRYTGPLNMVIYGVDVPLKILEGGIGRCEEFSVVYAAICVAYGYDVRLVRSCPPGDHMWVEIKLDDMWIHVDPSDGIIDDSFRYHRGNYTLVRLLAYERYRYVDITQARAHTQAQY